MKFYHLITLFTFLMIQASFAQSKTGQDKTEVPRLTTESLRLETTVELYPNPTEEYLNITLQNSRLKNVEFEMFNVIGNKMEFDLEQMSAVNYKANVKELKPGYYLLVVKDNATRFRKAFKFRKQ